MKIKQVQTEREIKEVRHLFRQYEQFLNIDLGFQEFENELADLPGRYAPPEGALLIAVSGHSVLGCVALRPLSKGVCEMKRLYVRPEYRGTGLGRRLALAIIEKAGELGYSFMRLDTLDRLAAAMHIYETLGFQKIEAYYDNPIPGVVYWELDLRP